MLIVRKFVMAAALLLGLGQTASARPFDAEDLVRLERVSDPVMSPDGRLVAYTLREPWSTNLDLWSAPASGEATPESLTADNAATDTTPVFSPDGRYLAWLAMSRPGFESDRYRIMLRDCRPGLRRGVHRLPRFHGLRPGVHGRHWRGLGRQAPGRPAEGLGGGPRAVPLPRRGAGLRSGRQLWRLHDDWIAGAWPEHRDSGSPNGKWAVRSSKTRRATSGTTRSTGFPSGAPRCW